MDASRTTTGSPESDVRDSVDEATGAPAGPGTTAGPAATARTAVPAAAAEPVATDGSDAVARLDAPGVESCDSAERVGGIGHALFRVGRAHRAAAARLLREIGLYPGQEIMLGHLADHGEARQSQLVAEIGTDPSTVTKMLQRLERAGLVERRPDTADRRVSVVALTDRGRDLQGRIEESWRRLDAITCEGFTADDRERLADLLARLEQNLVTCQED